MDAGWRDTFREQHPDVHGYTCVSCGKGKAGYYERSISSFNDELQEPRSLATHKHRVLRNVHLSL